MTCEYTFAGPDGREIKIVGRPALKAYLASGGLEYLMPKRAIAAGIQQAMAPAMSRNGPTTTRSKKIEDTYRLASGILSHYKNEPKLEIVETLDDPSVPQEVRDEDRKQREGGATDPVRGFLWGNTVFLVNSELKTTKDVAEVLFHETLGHYGLRGVFGKSLDGILEQIIEARKAEVLAKATAYGKKAANHADMLVAAEEVLAEMAQTRPDLGFVQRAIAAIKTWLRKNVPGFADMNLTDDEIIRDFILPARAFVQQGEATGKAMAKVAFSRGTLKPTFFSQLAKSFGEAKQASMPGAQWASWLDSNAAKMQIKADEIEWTGIKDYLALKGKEKVSKDDIAEYLSQNGVQVEEVMKGGKDVATEKYIQEWMDGADAGVRQEDDGFVAYYGGGDIFKTFESEEDALAALRAEALSELDNYTEDDGVKTKYASYQLPGGENYRELLLTLPTFGPSLSLRPPLSEFPSEYVTLFDRRQPEGRQYAVIQEGQSAAISYGGVRAGTAEEARAQALAVMNSERENADRDAHRDAQKAASYRSSHWNEANVIAHVRFNDRTDAEGNKVLFIEELQSDWAQDGRKKGFSEDIYAKERASLDAELRQLNQNARELRDKGERPSATDRERMRRIESQLETMGPEKGVPSAPFVNDTKAWLSLGIKRMIAYAAENGYDKVAFVNGEQSVVRYEQALRKEIDRIEYEPISADDGKPGTYEVYAYGKAGNEVFHEDEIGIDRVEEVLGKEIAQKIQDREGTKSQEGYRNWHKLSGLDLKVGGEGMKSFYDKIVPQTANDVLKKLGGGKVEAVNIGTGAASRLAVVPRNGEFAIIDLDASIGSDREYQGLYPTRQEAEAARKAISRNDQPGFTITPAMREKVSAGLPMFSRAKTPATVPTSLKPEEQGVLRRMQAALQDNVNRVRQVQDRIEKILGAKLPDHANYYGADSNRPGRIAARLEDAQNKLFKPLMQKLAKSGFKQDQLEELLHAMHAQERNEAIARVNDEMPDGGSGMMTADAQVILDKYKGKTALLKLADEARQIASATLDLKLSYGLITQESYDALAKAYDYYVPLKGDGEYGPKVKRALGHDEREEHILQNITRDYDQAVVVGEKNLARQALLAMVLTNPDPDLWTVGMPPKGRTVTGSFYEVSVGGDNIVKFTNLAEATLFAEQIGSTASIEYVAEGVRSFVKPLQDNEVMVYVEGRAVRIQIKGDEQLARQLRPLNQAQMNPILEGMRTVMRYLSKIYTGYNPAFILKNAARDASTGTINIMGNEGTLMAAKAWANYPAALKTMGQWAATKKIPAGETGAYLAEYRAQGGKVGASYMGDLEQQGATLERLFDDAYGATGYLKDGKPTKAAMIAGRKIVGGMAHVVEIANQATENGLRLALFMALRKSGKSAAEAARSAKNVTVDFDRKGSMTGALGAIYLFFNPAVQGTANALKTLVRGNHKGQAMTALGALGLLGLYAASQGMDDDKDRWLGEKWDMRTKNLILNVGGHRISVPMSQEFAPFYAMGVAIGEAMRGESPVKASAHILSSFIDAYFPLRGVWDYDSDNKGADAIGAFVPTVIKPGFEVATNRNSFGSQVVPENEFTKSRPDNLKMFRATKNTPFDKAAQSIAAAGEAMGAGKYENDISKVSPETLKYAWRTYTGGLGSFVTDTIGVGSMISSDPSQVVSSDVPFVKDFYKVNDVKPIRSRFYQLADEVKAAAAEFKEAKKAGDGEAIDQMFARPGKADLIGLEKLVKHTAKAAAEIRDQEVDINADPKMTPAEKKAALKELEKQEEEIYRSAIDAFK